MKMRWPIALSFMLPALALYGLFVLLPAARGLYYSLTDFSGAGAARFVGLANYSRILADPNALVSIRNTLLYAGVVTVLQTVLGLLLALWMGNAASVRNFSRVALFAPSMLSGVVISFIWTYVYSPLGGLLNTALEALGLGNLKAVWLGDPATALLSVAAVQVWTFTGQTAAIYLANYLNISQEVRESATLDGAGFWQRFAYVEWPLLAPATTVSVTLTLIGALRVFDLPFLLTRGGPGNASEVLGISIFRAAFSEQRFGYGAALAAVLTVFVVFVSVGLTRILRSREAAL